MASIENRHKLNDEKDGKKPSLRRASSTDKNGTDDKTSDDGRPTLKRRPDDNEQTVANRLQVFDEATRPLIEYYRHRGLLHMIDASRDPDTVTAAILDSLGVG